MIFFYPYFKKLTLTAFFPIHLSFSKEKMYNKTTQTHTHTKTQPKNYLKYYIKALLSL